MPDIEIYIGDAELEFLAQWLETVPEDRKGTIPMRILRRIVEAAHGA